MNKKLLYKILIVELMLCLLIVDCEDNKRGIYKSDNKVIEVVTDDLDAKLDSFTGVLDKYNDSIKQLDYETKQTIQAIESDTCNTSIYDKFKQLLKELS